jgi:LDH2 family malate/lactate/ureidoglycolate dehydrogenase
MKVLPANVLKRLGTEIFMAVGASREKAEFVAETIVEASLTGHDSHGVRYFVRYSERAREGFINVEEEPVVVKESAVSALVDGRWTFGQITAMRAMELAVEKARKNVIGAVGAYNCNHIGRVGYYTAWAAGQGVVAIMFVNVGNPSVSVYGGLGRVFGTNPLSVSVPSSGGNPFLLDYATSMVAAGKVSVARAKHEKIPTHWIRDKNGGVTDDPNDLTDDGWLLPFGEHKGYCLQLLMELMGAVMTGSRSGVDPRGAHTPSPNGVFIIAINPDGFVGREVFERRTGEVLHKVRVSEPEPGRKILIPGDPEWETQERRLKEGIPIPDDTWALVEELAEEIGIPVPN